MKKLLTLLGLCMALATPAFADRIAKVGDDSIILRESACPAEIAALVPNAEARKQLKLADAIVQQQIFKGCYVQVDGGVLVILEDGRAGAFPDEAFKDYVGV